jgi:hypothetical protein
MWNQLIREGWGRETVKFTYSRKRKGREPAAPYRPEARDWAERVAVRLARFRKKPAAPSSESAARSRNQLPRSNVSSCCGAELACAKAATPA